MGKTEHLKRMFTLISVSRFIFEPRREKPVFGVSDQVRHKPAVQPQKMARGLKFRI